jgi:hypothetical protein
VKTIWVVLIAVIALAVGLFAGLRFAVAPGMFGGMVVGSSYGACSVVMDLIEQKALPRERAEEYYGRFAGRLETLLKSSGMTTVSAPLLSKCEEDIEKFRAEAARQAKQ